MGVQFDLAIAIEVVNFVKASATDTTVYKHLCKEVYSTYETLLQPASWSSGNAFVSGAEGGRLKYRAVQIRLSVANSSPTLRRFFGRSCVARAQ